MVLSLVEKRRQRKTSLFTLYFPLSLPLLSLSFSPLSLSVSLLSLSPFLSLSLYFFRRWCRRRRAKRGSMSAPYVPFSLFLSISHVCIGSFLTLLYRLQSFAWWDDSAAFEARRAGGSPWRSRQGLSVTHTLPLPPSPSLSRALSHTQSLSPSL